MLCCFLEWVQDLLWEGHVAAEGSTATKYTLLDAGLQFSHVGTESWVLHHAWSVYAELMISGFPALATRSRAQTMNPSQS